MASSSSVVEHPYSNGPVVVSMHSAIACMPIALARPMARVGVSHILVSMSPSFFLSADTMVSGSGLFNQRNAQNLIGGARIEGSVEPDVPLQTVIWSSHEVPSLNCITLPQEVRRLRSRDAIRAYSAQCLDGSEHGRCERSRKHDAKSPY